MTLEEALSGIETPREIRDTLRIVTVPHLSFEGEVCEGQLVVHTDVADEVLDIFKSLVEAEFRIEKIVPIVAYGWDDGASMADNNSSAFNYRVIAGTDRLSNHSFGRAIDINPMLNPYTQRDGVVVPAGAQYDPTRPGTITTSIADIFTSRGWEWGGAWTQRKDWQHFEKPGR